MDDGTGVLVRTWVQGRGTAPEPPGQLFKYLERRWADAMIERGAIRIGTLHGFRRIEEHGDEIGDRDEGIVTACSTDPIVDLQRPETVSPVVRKVLGMPADTTPPPVVFQD